MSRAPRRGERKPKGVLYSAYLFRDKDPAIDEIRTVMQDHYGTPNLSQDNYEDVTEKGGPSASCVRQWFEGKTRRPHNATLEAAGRAIGYKRVWVKDK